MTSSDPFPDPSAAAILVWADAAPRIMTMVPLVRALRDAGHDARLAFPPALQAEAERSGLLAGISSGAVPKAALAALEGIDVFVASDLAVGLGPPGAVRVALLHSLPDEDLTYNHTRVFRRRWQLGCEADYFCIAVRQSRRQWRSEAFAPVIDRIYPPAMLAGRRPALSIVPLGYPKIDLLIAEAADLPKPDTITYAPTQTTHVASSLGDAGPAIIAELLARFPQHRIALRPYPGRDLARAQDIAAAFADDPRFVLDDSATGEALMRQSAVVVTDRSSMALSYALGYARPAVFFAAGGLETPDPQGVVPFDPVGFRAGSVGAVGDAVARALSEADRIGERIVATRDAHIHNPGGAAQYLAQAMPDILAGRPRADWLEIPRRPFVARTPAEITPQMERLERLIRGGQKEKALRRLERGYMADLPAPQPPQAATPPMTVTLADLARRGGPPKILVWASSAPRIMTMIPIVHALRRAGLAASLGLTPAIAREMRRDGLLGDVDHVVTSTIRLKRLAGLTVFVAAETEIDLGPERAIRVALYHSLPDRGLQYDYAAMFRRKPQVGAAMDYFCTAVQQPPRRWRVDHYLPAIDRIAPPALLRHRKRSLTLVPLGYPKIDLLIDRAGAGPRRDTITYAPTQTILSFSSVREAGAEIIAELLAHFPNYRIAFRPYPGHDVVKLRDIIARFEDDPRFVLDTSLTGDATMMRSAVVVTDRSSVAMSFALGLGRPAVFFNIRGVKGRDPQGVRRLDPVGFRAGSVTAVRRAVRRSLRERQEIGKRIRQTRGTYIHNPGHAADHLAAIMPDIIAGGTRADWLEIPRRPFASRDKTAIDAHLDRLAAAAGGRTKDQSIRVLAAGFETTTPVQRAVNLLRVARKRLSLRRYRSRPTPPDKGSPR